MATAPAPLPPDVVAQGSPEGARSAFSAQGVGQPQPEMQAIQMVLQGMQKFEKFFDDTVSQLRQIHPPLIATLQPMAQALVTLRGQLQQLAQRSGAAQGSPVMPQPPVQNPAAGPPEMNGQ